MSSDEFQKMVLKYLDRMKQIMHSYDPAAARIVKLGDLIDRLVVKVLKGENAENENRCKTQEEEKEEEHY